MIPTIKIILILVVVIGALTLSWLFGQKIKTFIVQNIFKYYDADKYPRVFFLIEFVCDLCLIILLNASVRGFQYTIYKIRLIFPVPEGDTVSSSYLNIDVINFLITIADVVSIVIFSLMAISTIYKVGKVHYDKVAKEYKRC